MSDLERESQAIAEGLPADPSLGRFIGPSSRVLVWDRATAMPIWASASSADLAASLDQDGTAAELRGKRIRDLIDRIAPASGFKLAQLPFGPGPEPPARVFACRRVTVGGERALLTVLIDPGAPDALARAVAPPEDTSAAADRAADDRAGPDEPSAPPRPAPAEPALDLAALRLRPPGRFTWRTDPEGRFEEVSAGLADWVGPVHAEIAGLSWPEVAGHRALDDGGRVASGLASRAPWGPFPVLWRLPDDLHAIPVELGAMPILDRARAFAGFRGFGIVRPGGITGLPDAVEPASPVPVRPDEAPTAAEPELPVPTDHPGPAEDAPAAEPRPGPAEDGQREAAGSRPAGGALSGAERGALHEIARVLGARLEEADAEPPARASADIVYIQPPRGRDPDLARVLDGLPLGIAILRDDVPVYGNRVLLDIAGATDLPDLVGRGGWLGLLGPASRTALAEAREPARVRLRRLGGEEVPVEIATMPINWGELPATLASVRALPPGSDLRDRVDALAVEVDEGRREAERLTREIEVASDGMVLLDGGGRIMALDPAAERVFGYGQNEIAGEDFLLLIMPGDHLGTVEALRPLWESATHGPVEVELHGRLRDGTARPLHVRAGRIAPTGDKLFALALRDAGRSGLTQRELREARHDAERSSARQLDFLARVSHEMRTPLNAMLGFTELMREERFGPLGSERYRGYLRDIWDSGSHLLNVVNDLLDFAKVASGQSEFDFAEVDLNALVRGSVELVGPIAARERAILRSSLAAELPRVVADERSVRQVVLNLLSNAIRFTGAGGQVIVSTAVAEPGQAILRIRDTGAGMTADEIEAALTPFRQVPSTRRNDGTGLGLPLSKALVEANGGVFAISGAPGQGTLVEVRLPVGRAGLANAAE